MKKLSLFLVMGFVLFFAGFVTPALGCHFCSVDIAADCEGFTLSGEVRANWQFHDGFTVNYSLEVDTGSGIIPVSGSVNFPVDSEETNLCVPFEISENWEQEFCGDVIITGTLEAVCKDDSDSATLEAVELFCPCGCTRTPGYWKNPKKVWPVDELTIGGVVYSRAELLQKLTLPVRGDISIKLFQHLIAAMLNVLNDPANNTASVQAIIAAADAYFADPTGCDKQCVVALKDALDEFNNSGEYLCD